MQEAIRFAILGFGVGALYSLSAQGLVLIYRGSGVLNFAHGAIGMVAAYLEWDLHTRNGWAFAPALVVGVGASALLGVLTHLLVMRPLRRASPLARIAATLGVLITIQAAIVLVYKPDVIYVPSALPDDLWRISGAITITADRVVLLAIAVVTSIGLWALYRYSRFGLATTAVAENQRAAAAVGWSPDLIAAANWGLGSALAGLAAVLVAPIVTLQPDTMTNLVLAATAAALVASFTSFPVAFAAGMVIGITQTEIARYVDQQGLSTSLPFMVIVLVLIFRGKSIPLRDFFLQSLPRVGTGRVRPPLVVFGVAVATVLIVTLPPVWLSALTVCLGTALILLSIVVVTGYAGQISLAQYALAGFGAWIAGRLIAAQGWPFEAALLAGVLGTVPLGLLFALPAVRTRGISLAVVTLGLGTALELMLFNNGDFVGGFSGTAVGTTKIFGLSIDQTDHPERYAYFSLGCFLLAGLVVANLRRGRSGLRLLAVRTNERAAAALGISVSGAKLYAFGVSAALAALGGIVIAFQFQTISYSTTFTNLSSITAVGYSIIGGIGFVFGPIVGAIMVPGSVGAQINNEIFSQNVTDYVNLAGGLILIITVLLNQDGVARDVVFRSAPLLERLRRKERAPRAAAALPPEATSRRRVAPKILKIEDLTVRYGPVEAVSSASLTVAPGTVVGLIGPNGAGKTTFIDAVTGFTRPAAGSVLLDGVDVTSWPAARRARSGLSRSFQSLELFEDLTVLDNLRAAADPHDSRSYARDLVYPVAQTLPAAVVTAIREFRLEADLATNVQDLSYGKRRLLAIARAVAAHPSVLLLDEPGAGLTDIETTELSHLVRRLADDWGMGILLVEHDMNFVMSVCDSIVVLDFGKKISEGSPDIVRRDPAVVTAYLGEPEDDGSAEPVLAAKQEG